MKPNIAPRAAARRETAMDYERPYRPLPVALANRLLPRSGVRWAFPLRAESLLERAQRATGLDDFGAESFREALEEQLRAMEDEARLTPLGHLMQHQRLSGVLTNRLTVESWFRAHPQIAETPLPPILVIAGLQRSGTTLLHRLLAAVPGTRALLSYEALAPAPSLVEHRRGRDSRAAQARRAERALHYLAPDFFAIHPIAAEAPEEDVLLLEHSFMSQVAEATLQVPRFSRYLETIDVSPAYRYMRRLLQLLQWRKPGKRWVLKTPAHLEHLDLLLETFPEAKVVQTHRDPLQTVGSFCSMVAHGCGVFSDAIDPPAIGRHWLRKIARMVERASAVRDEHGCGALEVAEAVASGTPQRVVDLQYHKLLEDPRGAVYQLLQWFGDETPSTGLDPVLDLALRANRQHKHGTHRYSLTAFGLKEGMIEEALAGYRERYAIPVEGR